MTDAELLSEAKRLTVEINQFVQRAAAEGVRVELTHQPFTMIGSVMCEMHAINLNRKLVNANER